MASVSVPSGAVRWWSAVASVASRDSFRSVLTGVLVESGPVWHPVCGEFVGVTLTATDSYRLMTVGIVDEAAESGSVLVPARVKVPARAGVLSFVWDSGDDLRETVGTVYADHLDRRDGVGAGDDLRPTVSVFTGETRTDVPQPASADMFPSWRSLIPDIGRLGAVESEPYGMNPDCLGSMLVAMGKAAGRDIPRLPVRCVAASANRPSLWEWVNDDRSVMATGLVMPVRVPDDVLGHRDRVAVSA